MSLGDNFRADTLEIQTWLFLTNFTFSSEKEEAKKRMGLSCTKEQGLKKEKLQSPKKKPALLRVWRKLRKCGKKNKIVLSMDEASGDLAKGRENQSPDPKSTKSESGLVKLIPEQNEARKTNIKPVEDKERSGGGQEPTGEVQETGEPEHGLPVVDMEKSGGGQEPTGEVQEMGETEQGAPVEDIEKSGGGQGPPDQKPSTTKWHGLFTPLQSLFNTLFLLAVDAGEAVLHVFFWLMYFFWLMCIVYVEILIILVILN